MERKELCILTEKQFTSLNKNIQEFINDKKGKGILNIFVSHTTCAIKIMEGELLLLADVNNYFDKTFPIDGHWLHDRIEIRDVPVNERINGFAHMRQLFFDVSTNIPVENGKMQIGKWQEVFLVEFDPIRERRVILTYWED